MLRCCVSLGPQITPSAHTCEMPPRLSRRSRVGGESNTSHLQFYTAPGTASGVTPWLGINCRTPSFEAAFLCGPGLQSQGYGGMVTGTT